MERPKANNLWLVPISCLLALVLGSISWPNEVQMWIPEWALMVVIYWVMALPYRFGIGFAFTIGLLVDVLEGSLLGSHAFAISFVAYWVLLLYQRIRMYPAIQQSFVVALLVGVYLTIEHGINSVVSVSSQGYWYLLPTLSSAFCWPVIYVLLRGLRVNMRVR